MNSVRDESARLSLDVRIQQYREEQKTDVDEALETMELLHNAMVNIGTGKIPRTERRLRLMAKEEGDIDE